MYVYICMHFYSTLIESCDACLNATPGKAAVSPSVGEETKCKERPRSLQRFGWRTKWSPWNFCDNRWP